MIGRVIYPVVLMILCCPLAHAVEHTKGQGEPYSLAGKRMVFTNWIFVRTGQLDWINPQGESAFGSPDKLGSGDARFRQLMAPRGVRLISEPAQRSEKPF